MSSWVRYSVAVYVGLLISGALSRPPIHVPSTAPVVAPSVQYKVPRGNRPLSPVSDPAPTTEADVSV